MTRVQQLHGEKDNKIRFLVWNSSTLSSEVDQLDIGVVLSNMKSNEPFIGLATQLVIPFPIFHLASFNFKGRVNTLSLGIHYAPPNMIIFSPCD